MSLQVSGSLSFRRSGTHFTNTKRSSHVSASLDTEVHRVASAKFASPSFEETKERIAKLLQKTELSISTYDTAWVAMVPSPYSSQKPCFPDSLKWLQENQCPDGSWARPHHHSLLQKDVLSSTLACVLALKKWGVGDEQISRGLHFIESNFTSATEKSQISPLGFDIIFPSMLEHASDLSLNLNLDPATLNGLVRARDLELKRCKQNQSVEGEAYLAFIAEGMGKLQDWRLNMKYQRRNGSLFNSPSTTAAACIALPNAGCLNYLKSALKRFGKTVPAVYPLDIYSQLCTVDNLEKLGISHYFVKEIQTLLDETYRCWLQGDEEIFMDASTCALAFRILRMNGYSVNSDNLVKFLQEGLPSSFNGNMKDMEKILQLYKATELAIYPDESDLEKKNLMFKHLLGQELSNGFTHSSQVEGSINQEADHALRYPSHATMNRIGTRRNIDTYNAINTRILKTSFSSPSFGNNDFFLLSVEDFNKCQTIHQKELKELERWILEYKLDKLEFARSKLAYCYFSAAATLSAPKLSDARISWAKNGVLTTVVDDFFDVGGSMEELENLIHLTELWDVDEAGMELASQNVRIIFSAIKGSVCEIADRAFARQERDVTDHIQEIWLDLMRSMMKEAEWARDNYFPTIDEYMRNAYVSFALGPIILPALYLVGPKLSDEMAHHSEYNTLFKLVSTCGRLLNDMKTCERELKDGKLNAVPLYEINSGGKETKDATIMEMNKLIDSNRRDLQRLVLERDSIIPKPCKDLFWHMCTVVHTFYSDNDGFTSEDMIKVAYSILHNPIVLDEVEESRCVVTVS